MSVSSQHFAIFETKSLDSLHDGLAQSFDHIISVYVYVCESVVGNLDDNNGNPAST
jgi:hypothetical protein